MRNYMILILTVCLMAVSCVASAQKVAVSMNAAGVAVLSPNLELSVVTGEKSSLHFDVCYSNEPYNLAFHLLSTGCEFKYWLSGSPFNRLYVGGKLQYSNYDYSRDDTRRYGDALIFGPTVGYDILLGKRWSFEVSTGMGAALYNGRFFKNGGVSSDSGISFVPVKLGISFIFILA